MQKRASASTSSGQASLLKRPRLAPIDQVWSLCERNLEPRSFFTEEDVRRVVREELEHAKSHSAEYCQSCTGNAPEDIVRSFENAVQKLVREELERAKSHCAEYCQSGNALKDILQQIGLMKIAVQKLTETVELANNQSPHLGRVNAKSMGKNDVRNLRLQLQTKLPGPLFTGKKLEGEGGARISVALIDANTGDVVTSGPESSMKLDVVVLEGDFNKDDGDDWAQQEFENYMVKERERKGPLLIGDLLVPLKGGVGELGELIFTDNSSWNRSKRFRIGLKVASGYCVNTRIREAKTDAFRVKEHRGEASKKHNLPAFDDEVWRLKMIAKDGKYHQKLNEAGIHKVGDFLLQLFTDPMKLKEILGMSLNSTNWDTLENHAKSCKTNWKLYLYYPDGVRKPGAVFNTDRELIGLTKDRIYCASHRLSADEKEHGDTIVKEAFDNWNDVMEFNGETFSCSVQRKSSSSFSSQVLQVENFSLVQCKLTPQICATPVGPEASLANVGSAAEFLGDQQCCHPVHDNMLLPRLASQVALVVPPESSASIVEVALLLLDCQQNHKVSIPQMPRRSKLLTVQTKWSLQQMKIYSRSDHCMSQHQTS
ncbi:calmodulin-binding protein 60 D isoform X2 [Eucalyptus grandis]|uniref:calmodulin-binding protein 60 D isoform X2 n=1 Tax=Eucalyptus grandis TaxID=71139 RepID=UPI00192ED89A|nr:calmodulin-binding protein 60 D isoform X2 [Eucalyptus grandis]